MRLHPKRLLTYVAVAGMVSVLYHVTQILLMGSNRTNTATVLPLLCSEKTNLVYIKMLKCASETLSTIFRRFGYNRKLVFVLPPKNKMYLGWPYQLASQYYKASTSGLYHILCEHSVYNATIFKSLMPADTIYVTSLREPLQQIKSLFNYYNIANLSGLAKDKSTSIVNYYKDLDHYEGIYKSHATAGRRYCIPDGFSLTKNPMAFTLGFPTGSFDDSEDRSRDDYAISEWLTALEKKFDLVMIVEYFVESLILFRRMMCWTWSDIIYIPRNLGQYGNDSKIDNYDNVLEEYHRQRGNVDYKLYFHFRNILLRKISKQKPEFHQEVKEFNLILNKVERFCSNKSAESDIYQVLHIEGTQWSTGFTIHRQDCKDFTLEFLPLIQERQGNLTSLYKPSNDDAIVKKPNYKTLC